MDPLTILLILGGATTLAVAMKKNPIDPSQWSVPDPTAPVAQYKTALLAKILDPAVMAHVDTWTKDAILAEVASVVPNKQHRGILKGILIKESGFFPAALAGMVYSYDNIKSKDGSPNSTAFGCTQVTRTTFDSVRDSTKYWQALPFRHEDLWYPPYALEAAYKVLLHKGLTKNPEAALKSYRGGSEEEGTKYANAVLKTAGMA